MSKAICSVKTPGCTYLGINATEKISGILEKENAKKVIVLTDRGVYDTGLARIGKWRGSMQTRASRVPASRSEQSSKR